MAFLADCDECGREQAIYVDDTPAVVCEGCGSKRLYYRGQLASDILADIQAEDEE